MYTPETTYEEFLKKEQEKYPELNLKDIEVLKERCKANPELPLLRAKEYVMFLHGCNFDVDAAYKTIVIHYKYRSELPQIFSKVDPASEEMKKVFETMSMSVVTKSNSGREECIVYTHFKNPDPQQYDYVKSVRYFFMLMEYVMVTNGTFDGLILTMNGKHMSWRHITKTPIHLLKKLLGFVQEALPIRLKEVHILNAGSIVTMLFNLTKPFMASGFIDKVTLYPEGSKEIFKHVPIEIMPTEMGGNGKSHYEYCEETFDQMLSFRDWYMTLDLVPQ